jgi:hypothetical protein
MSTTAPPRSQEDAGKRVPGWRLVLDALIGAPNHTLTNAQLGALRGVQAFHQRLSDLKRRGWVLTPATRVGRGYYAYRLVGFMVGSEAEADAAQYPAEATALPEALRPFRSEDAAARAVDATPVVFTGHAPRPAPPVPAAQPRAIADSIRTLQGALESHEDDLLVLAHEAARRLANLTRHRVEDARAHDEGDAAAESARNRLAEALGGAAPEDVLVALAVCAAERLERRHRQPRADRGPTGPQLMRKVLEEAAAPMHSGEIARRVLANGGDAVYHGKTPDATMAAQLATSNKSGGEFVKVAPGCFGLREWDEDTLGREPVRS